MQFLKNDELRTTTGKIHYALGKTCHIDLTACYVVLLENTYFEFTHIKKYKVISKKEKV